MTKRIISAETDIKWSDIYDNCESNSLDGFIECLESVRTKLNYDGWKDLKITIEADCCCDDPGDINFNITGLRPETDQEEAKRLKAEKRAADLEKARIEAKAKKLEAEKERELAELARLKAKYEEKQ